MRGPPGRVLLAAGMIGIGVLALIYGDFALVWQPVPAWIPWHQGLAWISGAIALAGGIGLLFERSASLATRVLFGYMLVWLFLKLPAVVIHPQVEVNWNGLGEIAIIMAGGWVLLATLGGEQRGTWMIFLTGDKGVRGARWLFGLALPGVGLSHFFYSQATLALVPAWLPFRIGWVYLAGAGHIAAGLGVLFAVWPRLAAMLEAWMIAVFTLLCWAPGIAAAPTDRLQWTAFTISWTIAAGAWVVADSYRGIPWTSIGRKHQLPGGAGRNW